MYSVLPKLFWYAFMSRHMPVMLDEVLDLLSIGREGQGRARYLDATFGGGGHARAILEADELGELLALDRDPEARERAYALEEAYPERFRFRAANFGDLAGMEEEGFNGILLDLGLSSFQLDSPERGFSFRFEGPVDMRMNPAEGQSAHEFLETASREMLVRAVRDYGEEPRWRAVVTAIMQARGTEHLSDIQKLAALVARTAARDPRGRGSKIHPATRTFQGIRIAVNRELEALEQVLPAAFSKLADGGVLAVISFHSLEDRIVKRFFNQCAGRPLHGRDSTPQQERVKKAELLTRKPLFPSEEETRENPRARSARLRALQKTGPT